MKKNMKKVFSEAENLDVNELAFTKTYALLNNGQSNRYWTGTMSNLMANLRKISSKRQREILPGSPAALRMVINKIANRLRNRGFSVKFGRTTDPKRTRYVTFSQ